MRPLLPTYLLDPRERGDTRKGYRETFERRFFGVLEKVEIGHDTSLQNEAMGEKVHSAYRPAHSLSGAYVASPLKAVFHLQIVGKCCERGDLIYASHGFSILARGLLRDANQVFGDQTDADTLSINGDKISRESHLRLSP